MAFRAGETGAKEGSQASREPRWEIQAPNPSPVVEGQGRGLDLERHAPREWLLVRQDLAAEPEGLDRHPGARTHRDRGPHDPGGTVDRGDRLQFVHEVEGQGKFMHRSRPVTDRQYGATL